MSTTTTASPGTVSTSGTSYTAKAIDVSITLGQGSFGTTGKNTVKLSNLRVVCTIEKAGMPSFDKAEIRIFGMKQDMMNQLTVLNVPTMMARPQNTILIEAGDAVSGMVPVFYGQIGNAWQSLRDTPEVFFQVVAWTGLEQKMAPAPPTSVQGQTDVATVMGSIAKQMGFAFENGGVNVQLASTYLPGSLMDQAHALARAARIELYVDSGTNPPTLAIWPRNQTRAGTTPLISPASGLVGYPEFQQMYMRFRCLLNSGLKLGGKIQMKSSIQPANGIWYIVGPLVYNISAQMPQGPWFCDVTCAPTLVQPPA